MDRLWLYEREGAPTAVPQGRLADFRAEDGGASEPMAPYLVDGQPQAVRRRDLERFRAAHPQAEPLDLVAGDDGAQQFVPRSKRAEFVRSLKGEARTKAARALTPMAREARTTRGEMAGAALRGAGQGAARGARDTAVSVAQGLAAAQAAVVGLLDFPTGGLAGKAAEKLGADYRPEVFEALRSPEQQAVNRKVAGSKGFVGRAAASLRNPSVIVQNTLQSLPTMAAGGVAGRLLAPALGLAPAAAGAVGEGVMQAGSALEAARQETPGGLVGPRQMLASAASGAMTAMIGAIGGKVAERLGIADPDTILAGGGTPAQRNLLARVLGGMVSEGALEELPQSATEQMMANVAAGRPMLDGVAEASAEGMLAGAAMGGLSNVTPTRGSVPTVPQAEGSVPTVPRAEGRTTEGTESTEASAAPDRATLDAAAKAALEEARAQGAAAAAAQGQTTEDTEGTEGRAATPARAAELVAGAATADEAGLDALADALAGSGDAEQATTAKRRKRVSKEGEPARYESVETRVSGGEARMGFDVRRGKDGAARIVRGKGAPVASPANVYRAMLEAGADPEAAARAARRKFGEEFEGPYGIGYGATEAEALAGALGGELGDIRRMVEDAGGIRLDDAGDQTLSALPRAMLWSSSNRDDKGRVLKGVTPDKLVTSLTADQLRQLGLEAGTATPDDLMQALGGADWARADSFAAANAEWRAEQRLFEGFEAQQRAEEAADAEQWQGFDFAAAEQAMDAAERQAAEEWARQSPDLDPEAWNIGDEVDVYGARYEVTGFEDGVVTLRRAETGEAVLLSLYDLTLNEDAQTEEGSNEGDREQGQAEPEAGGGDARAADEAAAAQGEAGAGKARGGAEGGAEGVARQGADAATPETKRRRSAKGPQAEVLAARGVADGAAAAAGVEGSPSKFTPAIAPGATAQPDPVGQGADSATGNYPEGRKPRLHMGMREAVELARALADGRLPKIKKRLRAAGGRAIGLFRSGPNGDPAARQIELKADTAQIVNEAVRGRLRAEAAREAQAAAPEGADPKDVAAMAERLYRTKVESEFQARKGEDPALAVSTLLHEIGHWVDDIPDGLRGRGNLFGHIAALKGYLKHALSRTPGGADALTDADKKALRKQARLNIGPKAALDAKGKNRTTVQESDADYLRRWNRETQRLIEAESERRGLVPLKTVRAELEALIAWYNEADAMPEYYETPAEMFADAFSAWMNFPAEVEARAPVFSGLMGEWLAARPEAQRAYQAIQDRLRQGPDSAARVREMEASMRAESDRAAKRAEDRQRRTGRELLDDLDAMFLRALNPVYRRMKRAGEAAQGRVAAALANMRYSRATTERMGTAWKNEVRMPLEAAGYTLENLNSFLFLTRVANEGDTTMADPERTRGRANLFNPYGVTRAEAARLLDEMRRADPAKHAAMERAAEAQREIRRRILLPILEASRVLSEEQYAMVVENWAYGRFEVGRDDAETLLDRMIGGAEGRGSKIHKQFGTLKPIGGVAENTLLFDMAFARWAEVQGAKREAMTALAATYTDPATAEVREAEYQWDLKAMKPVPVEVDSARVKTVFFVEEGQLKAYYAPTAVAAGLEKASATLGSDLAASMFARFVTTQAQLLTTRNFGFMLRNPIRDIRRAGRELPGLMYLPVIGNPRILALTLRNVPAAIRRARSLADPVVDQALRRHMPVSGEAYSAGDFYGPDDTLTKDLQRAGLKGQAQARGAALRVWRWAAEKLPLWARYAQWSETAVKLASMQYLDERYPNMPEHVKQRLVQRHGGTPDVLEQSIYGRSPAAKMLSLFYNINKESVLSRLEAWKARPGEQLFKSAMDLPATALGALARFGLLTAAVRTLQSWASGGDDDDEREQGMEAAAGMDGLLRVAETLEAQYASIPWREIVLYQALPLGWDNRETGSVRWLRMIDDQQNAAQRAMFFTSLYAAFGDGTSQDFLDLGLGEMTPSISPTANMLVGLLTYMSGDPIDMSFGFRRIITDPDQMKSEAGRARARRQMAGWMYNQLTGSGLGLWRYRDDNPLGQAEPGQWEQWLKQPGVPSLVGSFIRAGNGGQGEIVRKLLEDEQGRQYDAAQAVRAIVEGAMTGEEPDPATVAPLEDMMPRRVNQRILDATKRAELRTQYDRFTQAIEALPMDASEVVRMGLEARRQQLEDGLKE
jgi:hypothetical protein